MDKNEKLIRYSMQLAYLARNRQTGCDCKNIQDREIQAAGPY